VNSEGLLLETDVAPLAVAAPERLPLPIREAIKKGWAFFSVIAYREVMLKSMKATLDVGDPRQWWIDTLEVLALQPLAFLPDHVAVIHDLPLLHQDLADDRQDHCPVFLGAFSSASMIRHRT
jgi:PIN domain nuclease of toxin-antitoxin system